MLTPLPPGNSPHRALGPKSILSLSGGDSGGSSALPEKQENPPELAGETGRKLSAPPKVFVVVGPNKTFGNIVRAHLPQKDCKVFCCSNIVEALAFTETLDPDGLLLHFCAESPEDFAAALALRTSHATAPLILLTEDPHEQSWEATEEMGAIEVMPMANLALLPACLNRHA